MRLWSFRWALYQELGLDWSGLRVQQLCSTRAMGMPIMGEWYPTKWQRQQQQASGASPSPVRTPPAARGPEEPLRTVLVAAMATGEPAAAHGAPSPAPSRGPVVGGSSDLQPL